MKLIKNPTKQGRYFMKSHKGYTLVELLVTLSILGVISSFGIPSFYNTLQNQKAVSIAYELYHHLNYARNEAISKNHAVTVCASYDKNSCSRLKDWSYQSMVIFIDKNRNGQIDKEDEILKIKKFGLDHGSLMWRSFRNKSYLQWLPSGMTHYQNGNFVYCPASKNPKYAKTIIMNAAGRMYFGSDLNNDDIPEGRNGKNIDC